MNEVGRVCSCQEHADLGMHFVSARRVLRRRFFDHWNSTHRFRMCDFVARPEHLKGKANHIPRAVETEHRRSAASSFCGPMDTFGLTHAGRVRAGNDEQSLIADLKKSVIMHQTSLSSDDETHLTSGRRSNCFLSLMVSVAILLGIRPADSRFRVLFIIS